MHTKENTNQPVALFLFAHQDDELGILYEIEKSIQQKYCALCLYLTDGGYGRNRPEVRNRESYRVLTKIGVKKENIKFLGTMLCIEDTKLCYYTSLAIAAITKIIGDQEIACVYCPAWEGGHPDHDALYLIASMLIEQKNIQIPCWQYPLYNGANLIYPFFRVFQPLEDNGHVISKRIPIKKRLKYLHFCIYYKSQIKSLIGVLPLIAWNYLVDGHQHLQPIKRQINFARPHAGLLYYEKRDFMVWSEFETAIKRQNNSTLIRENPIGKRRSTNGVIAVD